MDIEVGVEYVIIANIAKYHRYKLGTIVKVVNLIKDSKGVNVIDNKGIQHYVHKDDIELLEFKNKNTADISYDENIEFIPRLQTDSILDDIIKAQQDRSIEDYVNIYLETGQFNALEKLLNNK